MTEILRKDSAFLFGDNRAKRQWETEQGVALNLLKNIAEEFGTSTSFTREDIVDSFGVLANDINFPGDKSAEKMALRINQYLDVLIEHKLIEGDDTEGYLVTDEGYQQAEEYENEDGDD